MRVGTSSSTTLGWAACIYQTLEHRRIGSIVLAEARLNATQRSGEASVQGTTGQAIHDVNVVGDGSKQRNGDKWWQSKLK